MWNADCHGPPHRSWWQHDLSRAVDPLEPVSVTGGGHLRLIELDGWFLSCQWLWEAWGRRGNIRQRGSARGCIQVLGFSRSLALSLSLFSLFFLLIPLVSLLSSVFFLLSSPISSPSLSLSLSIFLSVISIFLSYFLSRPTSLFIFVTLSFRFFYIFFSLPSSSRPSLFPRLSRAQSSPSFALALLIGFESPSVQCFMAGGASRLTCWRLTDGGWQLM